jgi:hypothetical protein
MLADVVRILEHAGGRFSLWLRQYEAWHGNNGITERNLSFQVAISFLSQFPDGVAFMEVPFATADARRTDKHLDAYLFSSALALLLESKVVWEPRHFDSVSDDIDRMTPALLQQLHARHSATPPLRTHGLVIAETWNSDIADRWRGNDNKGRRWNRTRLSAARQNGVWQFGALTVHQVGPGHDGTLNWLYGIGPPLTPAEAVTIVEPVELN